MAAFCMLRYWIVLIFIIRPTENEKSPGNIPGPSLYHLI